MKSNGPSQPRRQFSPTTKLQILKEGRTTNTPLSQVCDQYAISPTLFYQWERVAEQAALSAFAGQKRGRKKLRPSEEQLLAEVQRLREVIAELNAENLQLKKGRYTAEEKTTILNIVARAQALCPERDLAAILADLGLPRATYFRWSERELSDDLADRIVTPKREAIAPTPREAETVRDFATRQPLLGYKRLTDALMLENQAFLREWMVRQILAEAQLLGRRLLLPTLLCRPPEADHPDQRWHTDLSMWHFNARTAVTWCIANCC